MRFPLILVAALISSGLYAQEPRAVQLHVVGVKDGNTMTTLF